VPHLRFIETSLVSTSPLTEDISLETQQVGVAVNANVVRATEKKSWLHY
jgi:hypothetical protein